MMGLTLKKLREAKKKLEMWDEKIWRGNMCRKNYKIDKGGAVKKRFGLKGLIASFSQGEEVKGITTFKIDGRIRLIIATTKGVYFYPRTRKKKKPLVMSSNYLQPFINHPNKKT